MKISLAVYVMLIIFLQEVKGVIFAYFPPEIGRKITIFSLDPKQYLCTIKEGKETLNFPLMLPNVYNCYAG